MLDDVIVRWIALIVSLGLAVMKIGEWKRGREQTEKELRTGQQSQRALITAEHLRLELEAHSAACRDDARRIVADVLESYLDEQAEMRTELRRHLDLLIQLQINAASHRKDSTS